MDIKIIQLYYLTPNSNFFFRCLLKISQDLYLLKEAATLVKYRMRQSKVKQLKIINKTTKNHKQNN